MTLLQLRKITARWVPNILTENQRFERVRICKENLEKFNRETWRLCDVITGDESWFYHKQIGRKISNAAWTPVGSTSIFFKTTGSVIIHHVERGETINHQYYVNNCLQPLIDKIWKQRPTSGTHAVKLHHDNAKPHTCIKTFCVISNQTDSNSLHRAVTVIMNSFSKEDYKKKTFDSLDETDAIVCR
mgnify:FL=1